MKISVIGAAGMVGSAIVDEARARGHKVITYTRSGRLKGSESLNFSDTGRVTEIANASDVTVITLAGRDDYDSVVAAHQALIAARPQGRLLVVGGAGALRVGDKLLMELPEFPADYLAEAQAFAEVYRSYEQSRGLTWSMIVPSPEIMPGIRTGDYRVELNTPAGTFGSAQDFAGALLDEVENPSHAGQRFTVASAKEEEARGN